MVAQVPTDWLVETITAVQQGDSKAEVELFKGLWLPTVRLAIRIQQRTPLAARGVSYAEDAAARAIAKLYENIQSLTEPGGTMSWLATVIRNDLITVGKKEVRSVPTDEISNFDRGITDPQSALTTPSPCF